MLANTCNACLSLFFVICARSPFANVPPLHTPVMISAHVLCSMMCHCAVLVIKIDRQLYAGEGPYEPSPVFTVTMCVVLASCLVLGAALLMREVRSERGRLELEASRTSARLLRYRETGEAVATPTICEGHFHVFLSHVWSTGQDQMRIVKTRLLELLPGVRAFLDIDDLDEGKGAEFVVRSENVLVFVQEGYFASPNCMRELLRATLEGVPIITLLEPDRMKGGLSGRPELILALLEEASAQYEHWGLTREMVEWGYPAPSAQQLHDALFAHAPIEWDRLLAFQDMTVRLLADRLLPEGHGETFVRDEVAKRQPHMLPQHCTELGRSFHVYCSTSNNPGALELLVELAAAHELRLTHEPLDVSPQAGEVRPMKLSVSPRHESSGLSPRLHVSTSAYEVGASEHMLLYLNSQTWTRGEQQNAALADEVAHAMHVGTHVLLAHEMPGEDAAARNGVEFASFFATTPHVLLQRNMVYAEIAVPLKGGVHRAVSLQMLQSALSARQVGTTLGDA